MQVWSWCKGKVGPPACCLAASRPSHPGGAARISGSVAQQRGVICRLRCCGHPLDQKCNDLTGDAACPTHVEAARRLRAKVAKQHVLGSGQSRPHSPHSPVPQILYWSQTERISWSLDCLSSQAGRPRRKRPHRSGAMCRVRWSGAASGARPRHVRGPVWSEWSAAFQRCKKRAKY
jgi:hypothetical protein